MLLKYLQHYRPIWKLSQDELLCSEGRNGKTSTISPVYLSFSLSPSLHPHLLPPPPVAPPPTIYPSPSTPAIPLAYHYVWTVCHSRY